MPIPFAIAALVKGLVANGLGTLAGAVAAKGKEYIEEKIGVKIPDSADGLTGDKLLELKKAEMEHEEVLVNAALEEKRLELDAEKHAGSQVSERWKADMTSDSWLSKNVRPGTLAYWTVVISIMAFASQWVKVDPAWIELIKVSYVTILAAYFVGRSVQHVSSIRERAKEMKNGAGS